MSCENKVQLKGLYIPRAILVSDLTRIDKMIYGLIYSLSNTKGYCFTSNPFISKIIGCSIISVKDSLQRLEERSLIVRKTWTVKGRTTKRYIYLTSSDEMEMPSGAKLKDKNKTYSFTDDDLSFFKDMWSNYTINYVKKIKNSKSGKYRGGGSKHNAKESFRILLKNGLTTDDIQDFVSDNMELDAPKDLCRLLNLGEMKEFVKSDGMIKMKDVVTGEIHSFSEAEAKDKEGKRWERV